MPKAAYDERRERLIQELIARFGEFKKVVRMRTGDGATRKETINLRASF